MATTVNRFRAGTAGTTDAGTTPVTGSNTGIITNIILSNKTGSTRTVTITVGGFSFCTGLQVPANGTVNFDIRQVMTGSDAIYVAASSNSSIDVSISGVEVTA